MPYQIELGMPPAGYAVSAAREAEIARVQYLEFTSTEDGQHFVQRLEGFPDELLQKVSLQRRFSPSQVDNLLAVIRRDGKATVYVNELLQTVAIQIGRPIEKGAVVMMSDIVDVHRLELGVDIPSDNGLLFLFSIGWRKGLFYDFGPIGGPHPQPRKFDLAAVLGQAYCHVLFQERFSISDDEWNALFAAKWFLFAGLRPDTIKSLIAYVRAGWDPDSLTEKVVTEIKENIPAMLEAWRRHTSFSDHMTILQRAADRFHEGDYVSCTGLLFPRIEGLLRTHHTSSGATNPPSPDNLTDSAVAFKIDNAKCLLLPHRFARYLRDVYFANFNPVAQNIDVSRHSVAHGVAATSNFNQKSAALAILVVNHLFHCLQR
jgi:hypothetical protein